MKILHSLYFGFKRPYMMAFSGMLLVLTIVGLAGGVKPVMGQSKAEQCRAANELLEEYEKRAKTLSDELAYTASNENAARDRLSAYNKAIVDPKRSEPGHYLKLYVDSVTDRRTVVEGMGLSWNDRFETDDLFFLQKLRERQIQQVDRIKYVLTHQAEIHEQRSEADRQTALQRQRVLDLKCNEKVDKPALPRSKDDLSGTWVAVVPNPDGNCTMKFSFTLVLIGKEAWTGPLSSGGDCKSQPTGVIGQLNLTVIGRGTLSGNLAGQQFKATFDNSKMSFPIGFAELTFTRK